MLEIHELECGYKEEALIKNISFSINKGDVIALLGPNGVGKTTLFKTILGLIPKIKGEITLDGKSIYSYSRRDLSKKISYVPQIYTYPFPYKVIEMVVMGRNAHLSKFNSPSKKDYEVALKYMNYLGILNLKDKIFTKLSGGEKQLVLIARSLVQEADILVMDEPTSNLDFGNQINILNLIKTLANEKKLGVIITTHTPDHVFICASKVVALGKNGYFKIGNVNEVMISDCLNNIYDMNISICDVVVKNAVKNKVCIPIT